MTDLPAEFVGTRTVARVSFLDIDLDTFRDPAGTDFERVAIRHPGAVGIVAVDGDEVILMRQFRAPLGAMLLEIPAGKLDVPGEEREAAAIRECEEETGYRPGRLEYLRAIHTTPGFSDERIDLYLGSDLEYRGAQPDGPEEHSAEIVRLGPAEVREAMADGTITDAKTLIGLSDWLGRRAGP